MSDPAHGPEEQARRDEGLVRKAPPGLPMKMYGMSRPMGVNETGDALARGPQGNRVLVGRRRTNSDDAPSADERQTHISKGLSIDPIKDAPASFMVMSSRIQLGASMFMIGLASCTSDVLSWAPTLDSGVMDASDSGLDGIDGGKPVTEGLYRVNEAGEIMYRGAVIQVFGVNWFGLEGRHEPDGSAPMLLFTGPWTIDETLTRLTARRNEATSAGPGLGGFNTLRIPTAPQTLDDWVAREQLAALIRAADRLGVHVILDIHSCSNFVGWRAGRLDAAPPYADSGRGPGYIYGRDEYACTTGTGASHEHAYDRQLWLDDLRELASLPGELGVDNVLGIDLFNEPFGYTWEEWKSLAEYGAEAIMSVNDDVLIIMEGVGDLSPYGTINPNWGENLGPVAVDPPAIPRERLVLSAHTYGPSVFVQDHFLNTSGMIDLDPNVLRRGWEEHFGFVKDLNYGFLMGEFGGDITVEGDLAWQNLLIDYLLDRGHTNFTYWSLNPESGDTGGIFDMDRDTGWGIWLEPINEKLDLIARLKRVP